MNRCSILCVAALTAVAGALAIAQPAKEKPATKPTAAPAAQPEVKPALPDATPKMDMQLPPGFTPEMMKACMDAATPGPMHELMAKGVGTWKGTSTMWMAPGTEPIKTESLATVKNILGGRFNTLEVKGEFPGMGPFEGFAISGYDNVSKKFYMTWADNFGTGMMIGTGEISSDHSTITWDLTFNCPVDKTAKKFREIDKHHADGTMTVEMFGPDMVTGKEFKMMEITYTRVPEAKPATAPKGM